MSSRTLITRQVFISVFKCDCGAKTEYHHGGNKTREAAMTDLPSSGKWNGWKITHPVTCPICRNSTLSQRGKHEPESSSKTTQTRS